MLLEAIKKSVKNMEVGKMIQAYEITAVFNGKIYKMSGSIETENGVKENTAKYMCEELRSRFPEYENFKFYLESNLIYEE